MKTIKGPGIFLAQFVQEKSPYNSLDSLCKWASSLGYKGVQIPSWDACCIDLQQAAISKTYADTIQGIVAKYGLVITELSSHLQGQLVAVHPSYNNLFDGFAPSEVRGNAAERTKWAVQQLAYAAKASYNLGLKSHATFSGSLLWPYIYPWPQRPKGMVEEGFKELAKRWKPILDIFDRYDVNLCYEIHPGEDLHDGVSFERFLENVNNHQRACILYDPSHLLLQGVDYLQFIDFYYSHIHAFHVKDAELKTNGKQGVYGGYSSWVERAGRFRSLGDGEVDFKQIFTKMTQYGYDGWAVLEWECSLKSAEIGAMEGVPFIEKHIIPVTEKSFDDFVAADVDKQAVRKDLGLDAT